MTLYTCTVKGRNQEVLVNMIFHSLRLQGICSQCKPFLLLCFRTNTTQDQKCHAICRWHWQKKASEEKKTHVLKKQSHDDEHEGGKKLAPPCVPRGIVFHLASFKAILYWNLTTLTTHQPFGLKSWTWEGIDGKPTQEHQVRWCKKGAFCLPCQPFPPDVQDTRCFIKSAISS